MTASLLLYDYWRSSAAYRVRIALNLKGLDYQQRSIHLVRGGGEQRQTTYAALNPQQLVPALLHGELVLTQSMAIIEYLDEVFPQIPLLPSGPVERAQCRALSQLVACEMHPINNLRVLQYLVGPLSADDQQKMDWYFHWLRLGFTAFEALLVRYGRTQDYCLGMQPTLADCCLLPQVYNAKRFKFDLTPYPLIQQVIQTSEQQAAFIKAYPDNQADANT